MAQSALRLVMGQGSLRMRQDREDRFPVVEKLSGEFACLLMLSVLVALAAPTKRIQLVRVFRFQIPAWAFARFVYRLHEGL